MTGIGSSNREIDVKISEISERKTCFFAQLNQCPRGKC